MANNRCAECSIELARDENIMCIHCQLTRHRTLAREVIELLQVRFVASNANDHEAVLKATNEIDAKLREIAGEKE